MDAKELGAQPAAPFAAYEEEIKVKPTQHAGLTKREDFAKAALMGIRASGITADSRFAAAAALSDADALLAALSEGGTP